MSVGHDIIFRSKTSFDRMAPHKCHGIFLIPTYAECTMYFGYFLRLDRSAFGDQNFGVSANLGYLSS